MNSSLGYFVEKCHPHSIDFTSHQNAILIKSGFGEYLNQKVERREDRQNMECQKGTYS